MGPGVGIRDLFQALGSEQARRTSTANQLGEDVDLRRQTGANDYDTESVFLFIHIRESEEARPSEVA